jgi:hypothetical protein
VLEGALKSIVPLYETQQLQKQNPITIIAVILSLCALMINKSSPGCRIDLHPLQFVVEGVSTGRIDRESYRKITS